MNSQLNIWTFRAILLLLWSLGIFFWGRSCTRDASQPTIVQTDTLTVRDTVTIEKPTPVHVTVRDTIMVAVRDTVVQNDTTYIALPREVKTYGDERYTAVVSGYRPELEHLEIYVTDRIITRVAIPEPQKPKRWGLGIQVGAGATLQGQTVRISPYIGVGLSYDILQW